MRRTIIVDARLSLSPPCSILHLRSRFSQHFFILFCGHATFNLIFTCETFMVRAFSMVEREVKSFRLHRRRELAEEVLNSSTPSRSLPCHLYSASQNSLRPVQRVCSGGIIYNAEIHLANVIVIHRAVKRVSGALGSKRRHHTAIKWKTQLTYNIANSLSPKGGVRVHSQCRIC